MRVRPVQSEEIFSRGKRVLIRSAHVMTMTKRWGTIANGGVLVAQTREQGAVIKAVGRADELSARYEVPVLDLNDAIVVPGLINSHSHLELSHLAGKTCQGEGFTPWAESLHPLMQEDISREAIYNTLTRMRDTGTVLAADMAGYHAPEVADILEHEPLVDVLFMIQRMGFAKPRGESLRPYGFARSLMEKYLPCRRFSYAGHALYSTHPRTLQQTKTWCEDQQLSFALHLSESLDEVELLCNGTGPLAEALRRSGLLPAWFAPVGKTPVAYAHDLGLLGPTTLAVHCVHVNQEDIELLAATGTSVCLCPCSNAYLGVGSAPAAAMHKAGIRLCLGTDGLSSNNDVNLVREMQALLGLAPAMQLEEVIAMVTRNAATILGVSKEYGRIAPENKACLAMLEDGRD